MKSFTKCLTALLVAFALVASVKASDIYYYFVHNTGFDSQYEPANLQAWVLQGPYAPATQLQQYGYSIMCTVDTSYPVGHYWVGYVYTDTDGYVNAYAEIQ